ncbi:isoprenylcysteine carboxylmethyltransferase family protein [Gammaproteobacteria bacterium]|jgi:protein-S-isoprenylcysteine O-methyltransferase Ste14|nr:isoprenylcysteine carboxylmethyltransferase family protein [Gammaproteobacteria bacterium]
MKMIRLVRATSSRVFLIYPVLLVLVEWLLQGPALRLQLAGLPLLAWGYLQYRLSGRYRSRLGGGGPGLGKPPERIVSSGIYAYTRNPMYLGLLIFLAGLAVCLRSYLGLLLMLLHIPWFHRRVIGDEARLSELFGEEYSAYTRRVKRWIPGIA